MTGSPVVIDSPDALAPLVDTELGVSPWTVIDQALIDRFAADTRDEQWMHVDPVRAADGPYGGTIAHGYLVLSLLPWLTSTTYRVDDVSARVNYGLERVRFPAPVRAGQRIRLRARLDSVEPMSTGVRIVVRNTVEIDGSDRPACVAETVTLLLPEG